MNLLITTSSFDVAGCRPLETLTSRGWTIATNPHGRRLSEDEAASLIRAHDAHALLAGVEPAHGGRLGERFSLLTVEHPAVSLEWVKRAEDGQALVLRLVEWAGASTELVVHSGCPRVTAHRADLLELPGETLPSRAAEFRIRLPLGTLSA